MRLLLLGAAGLVSGAIGGMGIGGGVVLIPVLTAFFGVDQRNAQYINLLYFVPVAICALWVHMRAGRVQWRKALLMAAGGVAGAFFGSYAAGAVSTDLLRRLFGIFLFAVGADQLRKPKKNNDSMEE